MNKKLVVGVSLVFSALLLTQVSMVFAAKPQTVTFELETTGMHDVIDILYKGNSPMVVWHLIYWGTVEGDFEGSFTWIYWVKTKATDSSTFFEEQSIINAECTLNGEIAGKSGTLELEVKFIFAGEQKGIGHWKIISGTNDLVELEGGGKYTHGNDANTFGVFEGLIK